MEYNRLLLLLGKRIREERQKLNLTQEQLAEEVDVTPAFIGHIERGEKSLSLKTLVGVCNRLGVSFDYLLAESVQVKDGELINEIAQLLDGKTTKQKRAAVEILRTVIKHI